VKAKIYFVFCVGALFFSSFGFCAIEEKKSIQESKLVTDSPLGGIAWVEKCVEQYPEILFLANAEVRKTEEGQQAMQGHDSEQLFGEKFVEFDRTLMTLRCLKLILDGSDQAYERFTFAQGKEVKLSKESFQALHRLGKEIIHSGYEGLSSYELTQAIESALVLGDIGKSEKAREIFRPYGAIAPDHDDFHEEALQILKEHPDLCPTFARLSPAAQKLLCKSANLIHYGHITHLEGGPRMFSKLKKSQVSALEFSFDFFVHTCDVAGALGHVSRDSSLTYTQLTDQALRATFEACQLLIGEKKREVDAYDAYLAKRAHWLGLDSEERTNRVLTRVGCMLRLFTPEDGKLLKQAFSRLEPEASKKVMEQLENELDRTPTYMPAVLLNLSSNPQLGTKREERMIQTVVLGLPFLAKVLEKHQQAIKEEQANPEIPLNFNKAAGLAKATPQSLQEEFIVDTEGNVRLDLYQGTRAIIFDCDGVLVDTEYLKFLAWKEALAAQSVDFSLEEYMPLVGNTSEHILRAINKNKGLELASDVIQVKNQKYQHLQKQGVPKIEPMLDFVRYLAENKAALGLKLAVASSASQEEIRMNLRQIGLEDVFDVIVSGSDDLMDYGDREGKNKPKPYIYLETAKRLQLPPASCLVIEDTQAGIEAAAGAGMFPIAIPNRFTLNHQFSKARCVFSSQQELYPIAAFKN
jgi:HAD superfamily hydrolase (TIGR01509 family)